MQTLFLRPFALYVLIMLLTCQQSSADFHRSAKERIPANDHDSTKGFRKLLTGADHIPPPEGKFELNPEVIPFVNNFLPLVEEDYESMKSWGKPYFSVYDRILSSYGLPVELKYLSVIESDLHPNAVSNKGAVGPWQLMDYEAKRFGLKTDGKTDERTNVSKSTVVAAKLLKELYDQFGDWLLVIAAYNAGSGCVRKAMTKAHSKNFWDLQSYLPQETRNHVKKYIATHYYFEGGGGWTTLTAQETAEKKLMLASQQSKLDSALALANMSTIRIVGKYNALAVTNYLSMDMNEFDKLNPLFDKTLAAGEFYNLRLPIDKMELFKAKKLYILQESVQSLLAGAVASDQ